MLAAFRARPRPRPRRVVAAGLAGACALVVVPATGHASAGTHASVTIAVNHGSAGSVGTGFAGFSYEKSMVGAGMFDPNDAALVKLFRLLGTGYLRVGGNEVDIVNWNSAGAGGSATEIGPSDVTKLAAFAKATGWRVIYGINLKTNTPANAASEAAFAAHALGKNLVAFEIGNEPNVYDTEAAYEASFNTYTAAIRGKVPAAVFDGPGHVPARRMGRRRSPPTRRRTAWR